MKKKILQEVEIEGGRKLANKAELNQAKATNQTNIQKQVELKIAPW